MSMTRTIPTPPDSQILVLEQSGRWIRTLRRCWNHPTQSRRTRFCRLLDADDLLVEINFPGSNLVQIRLPTCVLIEFDDSPNKMMLPVIAKLIRRMPHVAFWACLEKKQYDAELALNHCGFIETYSSLRQIERLQIQMSRHIASFPPVEWPLDLRIKHSYPWDNRIRLPDGR
ncbi:MAG: hypothetical protein R3C03_06245 [Pirellulaceae bacterium]